MKITRTQLREIIKEELNKQSSKPLSESTLKQNWKLIHKTISGLGFKGGTSPGSDDIYDNTWGKTVTTPSGEKGVILVQMIPNYSTSLNSGEQTAFDMFMTYWPYQFQTVVKLLNKFGIKSLGPLTYRNLDKKMELLSDKEGVVKLSTKKFSLKPEEIQQKLQQAIQSGMSRLPK